MGDEMKAGLRMSAQAAIMRAVHGQPGVTRAQVAAEIGIPSGFAAETIARLVAARLICEQAAPSTGRRGRPTTSLCAHPDGPLVAAAAITHDTWQIAAVQLGGTKMAATVRPHQRNQARVLAAVTAELGTMNRRFGARIRAAAVTVPGTVVGSTLVHAPGLGWHDTDLSELWPRYEPGRQFVAGNDATLAGVAEARHGACAGAGTMVYLHLDTGIGGTVVEAGRAMRGTTGAAGEFGHMPFGDPARRCRCGATGCWNTSLDGRALARLLHQQVPGDDVGYLRRVLASAGAGQPGALSAIRAVASSIGRGVAGLVNGFDPHLVVIGGLGPELLHISADEVTAAYHDGLMAFRAIPPPPVVPARLGSDAPLLGAADEAFALLLTDEGLQAWAVRQL
jgi:predicted NBD/HSP70 family sugar kinase